MNTPRANNASLYLGLIILGAVTILLALRIPEVGAGSSRDPGPRAFPIALSAFIIAGATAQLIINAISQRRGQINRATENTAPEAIWKIGLLIAALVAYLALMPWIGFTTVTLPFALFLMRALGASWKMSAAVAFGLVITVLVLFQWAFRVQLPAGELGLPF